MWARIEHLWGIRIYCITVPCLDTAYTDDVDMTYLDVPALVFALGAAMLVWRCRYVTSKAIAMIFGGLVFGALVNIRDHRIAKSRLVAFRGSEQGFNCPSLPGQCLTVAGKFDGFGEQLLSIV
jgi:hypothetical protein